MTTLLNGIIKTEKGYAVKNFMEPGNVPIPIGELSFRDYRTAVNKIANWLCPESFRPYLLAVDGEPVNEDTWENLVFIGHAKGYYDHQAKKFRNARDMDMNAADDAEIAYIEALNSTYHSIKSMVKS